MQCIKMGQRFTGEKQTGMSVPFKCKTGKITEGSTLLCNVSDTNSQDTALTDKMSSIYTIFLENYLTETLYTEAVLSETNSAFNFYNINGSVLETRTKMDIQGLWCTFQVLHRLPMLHVGDEIHHSGWNACSSCFGDTSKKRNHLILPALGSDRVYSIDVATDPLAPRHAKVGS